MDFSVGIGECPKGVSASTGVGQAERLATTLYPSPKLKGQKSSENVRGVTTPEVPGIWNGPDWRQESTTGQREGPRGPFSSHTHGALLLRKGHPCNVKTTSCMGTLCAPGFIIEHPVLQVGEHMQ